MTSETTPDQVPIAVQLLTREGCKYCHEAQALLARLSREFPLTVELLAIESEPGREMALRHGVLFPPGVFIEDAFLQYGRPSERRLRARLTELQAGRRAEPGR